MQILQVLPQQDQDWNKVSIDGIIHVIFLLQDGVGECDIDNILKRASITVDAVEHDEGLLAAFKIASLSVNEDMAVEFAISGVKVLLGGPGSDPPITR